MNKTNRALVVLAAYDYESLAITLRSLTHTIDKNEKVVIVLNGKRHNIASEKTERVAREWAAANPAYRFAVRVLNCGKSAYAALTEAITQFEPLQSADFICKIDDDLIALKKGWVDELANSYEQLSTRQEIAFVTGLINNNCWGFAELIDLFDKKQEYNQIANYPTIAGDQAERTVPAGKIDMGICGTVWTYPYMAWWIHQWTSLNIPDFIAKTEEQPLKQISNDLLYSIGCIYFKRDLWLKLDAKKHNSWVDENLIHEYCKETGQQKWALNSQPMIHLFYRTHREANAALIKDLLPVLATHFKDDAFLSIASLESQDMQYVHDKVGDIHSKVTYLFNKIAGLSFMKKWKEKRKQQF